VYGKKGILSHDNELFILYLIHYDTDAKYLIIYNYDVLATDKDNGYDRTLKNLTDIQMASVETRERLSPNPSYYLPKLAEVARVRTSACRRNRC
jgi:hypothetical protein